MIYFIVNRTSKTGSGIKIWKKIREILREKGVLYKASFTRHKGHATELAQKISELPNDTIKLVAIGGDGTINEIINGISDFSKIIFSVIPTGSGNDFVRGIGMKGTLTERIERIIKTENIRTIDIGEVIHDDDARPSYFAISSGVGLDALVCKKALTSKQKKVLNFFHLGKLTYLLLTVESLFSMETVSVKVCFDRQEKIRFNKLIFAAGMNFVYEGGGVPMAPGADASDGRLSCCIAHGISKSRAFVSLPFLVAARHEKMDCFYIKDCTECTLEFEKKVVLHADGEYIDDVSKVRLRCLPGMLKVIL